jgi:hypothetical protein
MAVLLLVAGIGFGLFAQCQRSVRVHRDRAILDSFLAGISRENPSVYVCWEASMPYELVSPWDSLQSWSRMPLVSIAWTQRTPWHEAMKRQFGIDDLARAMCHRADIIVIAWKDYPALFSTFVHEHQGLDVDFVQLQDAPGKRFVAGRFERHDQQQASTVVHVNELRK